MALVTTEKMLKDAQAGHYAVGAFNVENLEFVMAVLAAAEETKSPVIMQTTPGTIKTAGLDYFYGMVKAAAERASVPVALHLDHGDGYDRCMQAFRTGYTSVMIDGSHESFEDNIALTREVVKLAHERGVTVEGELGVLAGVEDHVFAETSTYTNPLDAVKFIKATGVDALAISYGTKHGANKGAHAVIRKQIAIATKECLLHEGLFCALVSHGSSTVPQYIVKEINALGGTITNAYGIPKEQLKEVSKLGIAKINVDTDIRLAVTRNLRELFWYRPELRDRESIKPIYELLQTRTSDFDPRVFLTPIMDTVMYGLVPNEDVALIVEAIEKGVKEAVGTLIVDFDSYGKAPLVENVSLDEMAERYRKAGI